MIARILLFLSFLLTVGCSGWREVHQPWTTDSLSGWRTARATLHDGRVVMLAEALVVQDGDQLLLTGTPSGDAPAPRVPLREVRLIERGRPGFGEFMLDQALTIAIGGVIIAIAAL